MKAVAKLFLICGGLFLFWMLASKLIIGYFSAVSHHDVTEKGFWLPQSLAGAALSLLGGFAIRKEPWSAIGVVPLLFVSAALIGGSINSSLFQKEMRRKSMEAAAEFKQKWGDLKYPNGYRLENPTLTGGRSRESLLMATGDSPEAVAAYYKKHRPDLKEVKPVSGWAKYSLSPGAGKFPVIEIGRRMDHQGTEIHIAR